MVQDMVGRGEPSGALDIFRTNYSKYINLK